MRPCRSILLAAGCVLAGLTQGGSAARAQPLPAVPSPAVAVSPQDGTQYVFWRDRAGRLEETYFSGWWHGPMHLGWTSAAGPAAVVGSAGQPELFWPAPDGHIHAAAYDAGWHGQEDLTRVQRWGHAGLSAGAVTAVTDPSSGALDLLWTGRDRRIREAWFLDGWHGPRALGWAALSAPVAAAGPRGQVDVFWAGAHHDVEEAWQQGGWHGPIDLTRRERWGANGVTDDGVGVGISPRSGARLVMWPCQGRLCEASDPGSGSDRGSLSDPGPWSRPSLIGWRVGSPPAVTIARNGQRSVFWQTADGLVHEAWSHGGWGRPVTPFSPSGPAPPVGVTETTADLALGLTPLPSRRFGGLAPFGVPVINVDDRRRYQRVSGVGAAMTDTSAWLIWDELPPASRTALLDDLFGAAGIHLSFLTVPMGASDFTRNGTPYTYDDLPAGETDPALAQFSIAHDLSYIVPALQAARAINPQLTMFATPWTAPPWMKANGAYDDADRAGTLLASADQAYADYFVRFLQAYRALGLPIADIAPVNEPDNDAPFPAMSLPAASQGAWIAGDLIPALRAAGLSVKVYGGDVGWGSAPYAADVAGGPARSDLAGIAWHCYSGAPTVMSELERQSPVRDQIVTECSPGLAPYLIPELLIGAFRNGASALALWNLALDPAGGPVQPPNYGCGGCTGLVTVDPASATVSNTLTYYQLGQVSAFVQPGAVRIGSNTFVSFSPDPAGPGVTPGIDDAAFVNPDGGHVLVVFNGGPSAARVAVQWHGRTVTVAVPAGATVSLRWGPVPVNPSPSGG